MPADGDRKEHSKSPNKRSTKACDRCRLKKVKCDGLTPCARCGQDEAICQFNVRSVADGKSVSAAHVNQLQAHNAILVRAIRAIWETYALSQLPAPRQTSWTIHDIVRHTGVMDRLPHMPPEMLDFEDLDDQASAAGRSTDDGSRLSNGTSRGVDEDDEDVGDNNDEEDDDGGEDDDNDDGDDDEDDDNEENDDDEMISGGIDGAGMTAAAPHGKRRVRDGGGGGDDGNGPGEVDEQEESSFIETHEEHDDSQPTYPGADVHPLGMDVDEGWREPTSRELSARHGARHPALAPSPTVGSDSTAPAASNLGPADVDVPRRAGLVRANRPTQRLDFNHLAGPTASQLLQHAQLAQQRAVESERGVAMPSVYLASQRHERGLEGSFDGYSPQNVHYYLGGQQVQQQQQQLNLPHGHDGGGTRAGFGQDHPQPQPFLPYQIQQPQLQQQLQQQQQGEDAQDDIMFDYDPYELGHGE